MTSPIDQFISTFDKGLRTLSGNYAIQRTSPAANIEEPQLDADQTKHAAGLMRVNHCGEICAQALYEGQALVAKSDAARKTLSQAAQEELDHLGWCKQRLQELNAKPSVLDPLFYVASFGMGALTGLAGDKISLGFVEATEDQVVKHIDQHLKELPEEDQKSQAVLTQMSIDEASHGANALQLGGTEFPTGLKQIMTVISKLMTKTTYQI